MVDAQTISQYSIKDSNSLIEKLKGLSPSKKRQFPYPISLDVQSLYTNVPSMEAIELVYRKLSTNWLQYFNLTANDLRELLYVITGNCFFIYEGKCYKQIRGLPMGNAISGTLSNLFMHEIENEILSQIQFEYAIYCRYVDDIFILIKDEESAERILTRFNSKHNTIQFTLEKPTTHGQQQRISLLDFTYIIDGTRATHEIRFYQKACRKNIFLHQKSSVANTIKMNAIRNEYDRRILRCSEPAAAFRTIHDLRNRLSSMGYSGHTIAESFMNNPRSRVQEVEEANIFTSRYRMSTRTWTVKWRNCSETIIYHSD